MAIFKRKLLYLSGFDPRGARFYHALQAEQIAAHNEANPRDRLTISDRVRAKKAVGWTVSADDGSTVTEHEFLGWDDLVRRHWVKGPFALIGRTLSAYAHFITRFDWSLVRQVPSGSKIALFYPGASMVFPPLLLIVLLWPLLTILVGWLPAGLMAIGLAVALTVFLMRRIHSLWLLRFVIFNDMLARDGATPDLSERLAQFADRVDAALAEDWDEVLLVTHSNGGILAVPIMVALLDRYKGGLPAHFSLVTLGSCVQLIACRRDSIAFHALLDRLAASRFRWLDIGSPTDGACVPLIDPCLGRPVGRPPELVQLSPRWFRYSDPAAYTAQRRNKYETHFNYLRRLDKPSPLDYVGLSCSAWPLAESIAAFDVDNGRIEHG